MEQTRNRLTSLLSKEKSMRADIGHEDYVKKNIDARVASDPDIDSTPITTPEHIDLTKRRVSRMLQKNTLASSLHVDDPMKPPKVIRRSNLLFRETSDGNDLLAKETFRTPHKSTKKLLIPHPERTLYEPEDINPKKSIHQLYNERQERISNTAPSAYMPSSAKKKKLQNQRQQRYRDEYRDYAEEILHYESEESTFDLDLKIVREVDAKLMHRLSRLHNCKDSTGVVCEVHSALEDIRVLGVNSLQLWVRENHDTLWSMTASERQRVTAPINQLNHFGEDLINGQVCSSVNILKPNNDDNDEDDEVADRLATKRLDLHYQTVTDFMNGHKVEPYDSTDVKEWTAVHSIVLPSSIAPSTNNSGIAGGFLFCSEITAPSLPFTSSGGQRYLNLLNLRRQTIGQLLQRLTAAAVSRLEILRISEEQRDLQMRLIRLEEAAASHEALKSCETLLADESFNKPLFIASAVAKCGCFNDQYSVKMSWLLVQESEEGEPLFGSAATDAKSVCIFPGGKHHRVDFTSDLMVSSRRSHLIESLLSNRAGVVNAVTILELKESTLLPVTDESPVGLTLSLLFVPLVFKSAIGATASMVIALSPESSQDTVLAHAQSLARLAAASLDRLHSVKTRREQEALAEVSSILWNSSSDPHGQIDSDSALQSLISVMQSDSIRELLGVHGSTLLVSQQYAGEFLALAPVSSESSNFSAFLKLDGPLRGITVGAIDGYGWYHDLLGGKVVFYSPQEESQKQSGGFKTSVSAALRNVHVSLDGSGSSGSSSSSSSVRSGSVLHNAAAALQQLVSGVDSVTTSAMLIPLNTSGGLCVLVLSDRLHWNSSIDRSSIAFTAPYVSNLLASPFCSNLLHSLNSLHKARALRNKLTREVAESSQLKQQVVDSKYAICAVKWHRLVKSALDKAVEHEYAVRLSTALELVNHRRLLDSSAEEDSSFLQCVQKQVSLLFPSDVIMTSLIPFSGPLSSSSSGGEDETNEHITAVIYDHFHSAPYKTSFSSSSSSHKKHSHEEQQHHSSSRHRVVGHVRVCRSSKSKHPFTQKEAAKLKKFCEMSSDIFTALHRGLNRDFVDGDARGLLGPMLSQLLPSLLPSDNNRRTSPDLKSSLPLLVHWFKRVCRADMVVLRLHPPSEGGEIILSSEDIDARQLHGLERTLPQLSSRIAVEHSAGEEEDGDDNDDDSLDPQQTQNQWSIKLIDQKHEGSVLGEVKIFGASKQKQPHQHVQVTPDQTAAASLLSFLLSAAMSAQKSAVEQSAQTKDSVQVIQQLEGLVQQERAASELLRARLNQILTLLVFLARLSDASTPQGLSGAINEFLPSLLKASSAALLLAKSGVSHGNQELLASDDFSVVLPSPSSPSASDSVVTRHQLSQLPDYFTNSRAMQSKIELFSTSSPPQLIGAVLVFHSAETRNTFDENTAIESLSELLVGFVGSLVYQTAARCEAREERSTLIRKLKDSQDSVADKQQIQQNLEVAMDIASSLDQQKSQLQAELTNLKNKLEDQLQEKTASLLRIEEEVVQIKQKKDSMSERLNERIRGLENELVIERNRAQTANHTKEQLLEILSSFSFDQRCQQETITQWLSDIAESKDIGLITMAQAEGGSLSGGEGIRGILAAAGECIRTGTSVELTTSYQAVVDPNAPNEIVRGGSGGGGGKFGHSELRLDSLGGQQRFFGSSSSMRFSPRSGGTASPPAESISILCVPNRCISPQKAEEHACFVFVRSVGGSAASPDRDGKFTEDDKDVLNCAVNLTCRTLAKSVVKYSATDFRAVQSALEREVHLVKALRRSVDLAAHVRSRDFHSRLEVGRAMEEAVCELLKRRSDDACLVEAEVIFPPWTASSAVALGSDAEIVSRVITSCHSMLRGNVMWVPVVDGAEAVALVRCERKFNVNNAKSTDLLSPAELLMTEVDEEIVSVFGSLSVSLLNRVDLLAETLVGVKQAGSAIITLQKVNASLEDRCALELGNRLKLEESLKAGADMLGIASAHRVATGQLLDAARKAVLAVTAALDCFIVLPAHSSHAYTRDVEFLDSDTPDRDSVGSFFTMTSDRPQAIMVRFEPGDMEVGAMQSLRSVVTNIDGVDASTQISRPWQSWAVRRLQGELNYRNLVESTGNEELFAMSVPIVLQGGAKAVMTCIRRSIGLTATDREAMAWIGRVLAYCLELRGGDELRQVTRSLEAEVARLKHVDLVNAALDKDFLTLERDLHDIPIARRVETSEQQLQYVHKKLDVESWDQQGIEIVVSCAHSAFGNSSIVQSWSAEEAVQNFGVILPTESFNADGKTISKDTMVTEQGKITFWIDIDGDSCEGLDFFKTRQRRPSPQQLQQSEDSKHAAKSRHILGEDVTDTVLYIVVQMKGYPVCWLKISTFGNVVRNCRLRLALMLKLLEGQHIWRSQYHACVSLIDAKQAAVEQQAVAHKEMAETLQADLASALTAERGQAKLAERVIFESIFTCNHIRRDFSRIKLPLEGMRSWIQPILINAGKALSASSGFQVSLGLSSSSSTVGEEMASVSWLSAHEGQHHSADFKQLNALKDDPINQAVNTGKILLCLAKQDDTTQMRERLTALIEELESLHLHAKMDVLFVAASERFPAGCLITPIPLPALKCHLVAVTRPDADAALTHPSSTVLTCNQVLSSWIVSWVSLRSCIQTSVSDWIKQHRAEELSRKVAKVGLKRTFDKVDSSQLTLSLAFERMKSNRLLVKLDQAAAYQSRYSSASAQLHVLEQLAADWTEIVKGMNGACSTAIASGVQGLWAQSCSTLLSMMSSQLTITGCGLILHHASDHSDSGGRSELVEYCVRELTTPMAAPHTNRSSNTLFDQDHDDPNVTRELADYARGMLENRPASDLGQKVFHLVQEIMAGNGGPQRIFKLTRPRAYPGGGGGGGGGGRGEEGEHLWLVPVKTARSVLAVLRVSVEVPVDFISAPLSPIPKTRRSSSGDAADENLNTANLLNQTQRLSPEMLTQSAQSNMINFAEVMAPVFAITLQLDRKKRQSEMLDQSLRKQSHQLSQMSEEVSDVNRQVAALHTALGVLNKLFANEWPLKESVKASLTSLCEYVSVALGEVLNQRVSISITGSAGLAQLGFSHDTGGAAAAGGGGGADESSSRGLGEGKRSKKNLVDRAGPGALSQTLVDFKGDAFGSVIFESLGTSTERRRREGPQQQLTFDTADTGAANAGFAIVAKAVASVLSGKLMAYAKEASSRLKSVLLKDSVVQCEQSVVECRAKVEAMSQSCEFYRGLADVINQCLAFTTMQQHRDSETLSESDKLLELLRGLTNRLPALIGGSCLFNFAVVDSTAVSVEPSASGGGRPQEEGLKVLHWVYGSGVEETPAAGGLSPSTIQYLRLNEGVREISTNLAHSCIQKKTKSSFDVGLNASLESQIQMSMHLSTASQLRLSAVRILTFPLLHCHYPHQSLGAMQVMLDTNVEHGEVESLCDDIAKAIAAALTQAVMQQNLLAQLNGLELASIVLNSRISEESAVKQMWQQRCTSWRGAALLSSHLVSDILSADQTRDLVHILSSPVVAASLEHSGLQLHLRSSTGPQASLLSLPGTLATALIPVTESGDTIAEVTCSSNSSSGSGSGSHRISSDGLSPIASDLVESVSEVIRAGVRWNRLKHQDAESFEKRNASVAHKVEKLKQQLKLAKEELSETIMKKTETSYDLMCQVERYEALRSHASSAVTSMCLPAITEMVAMLQDVQRTSERLGSNSSSNNAASILEWAWDGLARVASRAVSRLSNGGFSYHVSVLARCSDASVGGSSTSSSSSRDVLVRVFDGAQVDSSKMVHNVKYTSTTPAGPAGSEGGSAVERCLRLGGIQENVGDAVLPVDLTGIQNHLLSSTFAKNLNNTSDISVLCVAMQNVHQEIVGMVRVVYREVNIAAEPVDADKPRSEVVDKFSVGLLKPVVEMLTVLGGALVQASSQQLSRFSEVNEILQGREQDQKKIADLQDHLQRSRQMCKVVVRESNALMDAPVVSQTGAAPRAIHPANLLPLAASQDTCLKLLSVVRTLLRSEGQALLMKDPATEPLTYQVIYTGDSLRWPGIEQATFGIVSSPSASASGRKSLAESAMHSRKSIQTADAPSDSRYCSYLDGVCSLGTPMLTVPLKGRGGSVVGVLIAAKARDGPSFSAEDIAAAEICTAMGSLSLYWCQGLGGLHHQLNKTAKKMDHLEKAMIKLKADKLDE